MASSVEKCPDCKGRKTITLLHSVVTCKACGGTGNAAMLPSLINLMREKAANAADMWEGQTYQGVPVTGRKMLGTAAAPFANVTPGSSHPVAPNPCTCFDCGVGMFVGNAYVLPSMPGEYFCQTHYNVRVNTHPGALHPPRPKAMPPKAGIIPCYNNTCPYNVPPGVRITHAAYHGHPNALFCSDKCAADQFARDSAAGAFPP